MGTQQAIKEPEELEAMSTEDFLGWLLTSCKIDEEEFKPIRRDVQDFLLGEMQSAGFNRELLPSLRVPLYDWLVRGAP